MEKKLTRQKVLDFLREVSVMNVAAILDQEPVSSVLLFTVDDNFVFNFATRKNSFKARAIEQNPRVSFSVWLHQRMLVQGKGMVHVVPETQVTHVLDNLTLSAGSIDNFWPPILSLEGGDYIVYKFVPEWIRALDLSDLKIKESENVFYEVEL